MCRCFMSEWLQTLWAGEQRVSSYVPGVGNAQIYQNGRNGRKIKLDQKFIKLGGDASTVMLSIS